MKIYNIISKILLLLFIPQLLWAEPTITPPWQIGDKWSVKAVYHSIMNKNEWSEPVYWEYHVADIKQNGSETYYVIEVKEQNEKKLNLTARFTYQMECKKITCNGSEMSEKCNIPMLIKAEITKPRRGKASVHTLEYEKGVPVWTEQTLIPFDTPVFPLCSPSSHDFATIRKISDDLKAKENVTQEIRQIKDVKEIKEITNALSLEKEVTEIKCMKKNKVIFVQYWQANLPFPLFGWNENMKYWLVNGS
jgi:hypothetical protein